MFKFSLVFINFVMISTKKLWIGGPTRVKMVPVPPDKDKDFIVVRGQGVSRT